MIIEKIFYSFSYYHHYRIVNYIKKFNISYYIDVGAHKGEFLEQILKFKYKKIYCFEPQKKNI